MNLDAIQSHGRQRRITKATNFRLFIQTSSFLHLQEHLKTFKISLVRELFKKLETEKVCFLDLCHSILQTQGVFLLVPPNRKK